MVAATAITLSQLVQSLATAVVQAQQQVEDHQVAGLDRYFDPDGRPHSLTIRTRSLRPDAAAAAAVPELALVLANNSNEGSVRIRLELEAVEAGDGRSRLLDHLAKTQGFIDR